MEQTFLFNNQTHERQFSIQAPHSPLTYYNENSCQVAGFLRGGGAGPDRGEGGLSHPRVDPQVHVGKVGERNDARTEESRPVDVVVHVVWVHTKHKYYEGILWKKVIFSI